MRAHRPFLFAMTLVFVWLTACSKPVNGAGPTIRETSSAPAQPKSAEAVMVAARVTDKDGVKEVTLRAQVVEPGRYVRKTDPAYQRSWRDFPMHDDGQAGDSRAGDGVFSVLVPPELQKHRRLVRYYVSATNRRGERSRVPEATNASPNFAWFVYDRVPAWTGASQPGVTPPMTFSGPFLETLPIYHLIARAEDVEKSQWDQAANRTPFFGTMVYDGQVYDHIQFHNRGQASTYISGKNKWGFKFNASERFQARNQAGRKYQFPWNSFNLNACASPWAQVNRGMAGMDEAVSYRAYQLAGVPSPDTFWVHFRVIDAEGEISSRSQFAGDLWGLYLVVQDKNGTWLRENGLPEGNIFSAESGAKSLAKGMPGDSSDWNQFSAASRRRQSEAWWREHWDLPAYYGFHAINRVIANVDLRHEGNHYLYHRPDDRWVVLPHDLDMMFIPKTHWPGVIHQTRCLDLPTLRLEYQNRAREVLDLLCSDPEPAGGQIGQLVAEYARVLCPPGLERTWPELDMAMWNWHPRSQSQGSFYRNPASDRRMGGSWRRTLATPDFAGFCRYVVEFCTDQRPAKTFAPNNGEQRGYGYGFLEWESKDPQVPARPAVEYAGQPRFPAGQLAFRVTPFSSAGGKACAAVQWRVAEISAPGLSGYSPGQPCRYEITPTWTSAELQSATGEMRLPAEVCQPGRTYRVRARYKDDTERWSRWSAAAQFVAGEASANR